MPQRGGARAPVRDGAARRKRGVLTLGVLPETITAADPLQTVRSGLVQMDAECPRAFECRAGLAVKSLKKNIKRHDPNH